MRRRAPSALLFALCAVLLAAGPAASLVIAKKKKEPQPFRLVPGRYDKKRSADAATPTASVFSLKGLTVRVEPLDAEGRARFIEEIRPGLGDPFAAPPGRPEPFMAFRVLFDNRTGQPVTFQPGNVMILTNKNDHRYTLDLTDLYLQAERAGVDDPQRAANRITPLIYDSSTTIPDGAQKERLLLFRALAGEDKWRELVMHFSFIQIGTETHTLSFTYHKEILED